jgi:hypothetical protein
MTYRKKAARAATPANARLPLTVEAAPVNLGGLECVEVVFFGITGLPVPIGADVWGARVVGHALIVTVTADRICGAELDTGAALETAIGVEVLW